MLFPAASDVKRGQGSTSLVSLSRHEQGGAPEEALRPTNRVELRFALKNSDRDVRSESRFCPLHGLPQK